jgi:hypothetical protein
LSFPESELRRRNQLIRNFLGQLEARFAGETARAAHRAVLSVLTAQALGVEDLLTVRYAAELASIGNLLAEGDRHFLFADELLSAEEFLHPAIPIIRHQHEHWDGSGVPLGLQGEAIPLGSRILLACREQESTIPDSWLDPAVLKAKRSLDHLVQPLPSRRSA